MYDSDLDARKEDQKKHPGLALLLKNFSDLIYVFLGAYKLLRFNLRFSGLLQTP